MKKEDIIKELKELGVPNVDETVTNSVLLETLKKVKEDRALATPSKPEEINPDNETLPIPNPRPEILDKPIVQPEETVSISKKDWDDVQKQLKMLYEVADKGRIFNYENNNTEKKPIKVKVSIIQGKTLVGWRTTKDELIKHPQTGKTIGEKQEFELVLLDNVGDKTTVLVDGYEAFSNARYNERVEAEVVSKKEDWKGNYTFDIKLPDGRIIPFDSRFVN